MSRSGDYDYDMADDVLADEAIEAFFLGLPHPGWEQDEALASLASHVSAAVDAPSPSPDHALLQLFWSGEAAARPAAVAAAPSGEPLDVVASGGTGVGRRRRLRVLASVATGMAVAVLGVGAAGATGALPAPAQRVVARVIEAVSPFEVPEPSGSGSGRSAPRGDGGGVDAGDAVTSTTTAETAPPIAVRPGGAPGGVPSPAPVPQLGGGTGLDRAGQTPAAELIPPAVPGPPAPGAPFNPTARDGNPRSIDTAPASRPGPSSPASRAPLARDEP